MTGFLLKRLIQIALRVVLKGLQSRLKGSGDLGGAVS